MLLKHLVKENYDITVIDIDPIKCRRAAENLDVIVVEGMVQVRIP